MKTKYTFTGATGGETTVIAETEADARDLAMRDRWKDAAPKIGPSEDGKYKGYGLILIREEKI